MARKQTLKVFRTAIGFHDAYVAAPSRKAALAAWGSDADLFARGIAELVTDETLVREPLEHPGKVIKRLRGTAEEQLAALPPDPPRKRPPGGEQASSRPSAKPAPRPSRAKLDAAERELTAITMRQEQEQRALRDRQHALDEERRKLGAQHERESQAAQRAIDRERKDYAAKLGG